MAEQTILQSGSAATRWFTLDANRTGVLQRARLCAALTIPRLLPPDGWKEADQLVPPYQALGARCVNNLAAKLQLTLFPPNTSFGRLGIEAGMANVLKQESGEGAITKAQKALGMVEQDVVDFVEQSGYRSVWAECIRHLIVTGNVMLYMPDKELAQSFALDSFVVRRSPNGKPLEMVIREFISKEEIPEEVERAVKLNETAKYPDTENHIPLYTHILWDKVDKVYKGHQELLGFKVPDTEFSYPEDKPMYLPMVWQRGQNYGTGHVEDYIGAFLALEGTTKALLEGAAAMALMIFLVNPTGMTRLEDIRKTKNTGFCAGRKEDISVLQAEKYADFQVPREEKNETSMMLARAFLLRESVQRDAERVTAEEIRLMAQELEDALGGIYSNLSTTGQLPIYKRVVAIMQTRGKLNPFPKEVKVTITTGFEALGRGHDLNKLKSAMQDVAAPFGNDLNVITREMNMTEYITRVFTAHGVNTDNLLKTEDQKAQDVTNAQAASFMNNAASAIVNQVGAQGAPAPTPAG